MAAPPVKAGPAPVPTTWILSPCPHLAAGVLGGPDVVLDGGDVSGGSGQQHGAAVNHGLAAPRARNDPATHNDAGKQPQRAFCLRVCEEFAWVPPHPLDFVNFLS